MPMTRIILFLSLLCCTCFPHTANAKEIFPDRWLAEIHVEAVDGNIVRFACIGTPSVDAQLGDSVGIEGMLVSKIDAYVVTVISPAGDRAALMAIGGGWGGGGR